MLSFFVGIYLLILPAAPIFIVNKLLFRFSDIDRYFNKAMCDAVKSNNKQTIHWTQLIFGANFYVVHT